MDCLPKRSPQKGGSISAVSAFKGTISMKVFIFLSIAAALCSAQNTGYAVTTVAGSYPLGDGGPAVSALLFPAGAVRDRFGNLFILDPANYRIQKVTPDGRISTILQDPTLWVDLKIAPDGTLYYITVQFGGLLFLAAQHKDGTFVGPMLLLGVASLAPAIPGETLTAYGIGFGDVTPSLNPGVIPSTTATLSDPRVIVGTSSAEITYAGIVPGSIGLYQFISSFPICRARITRSISALASR
jgi:hypothetical protein